MIPTLVSLGDYSLGEITGINFNEFQSDIRKVAQMDLNKLQSDIGIINSFLGEIMQINFDELKLDVKDFTQINFVQFKSDLEILAEQPPVKVYPYYERRSGRERKEINYEQGFRSIDVSAEPGSPFRLSYVVKDSVVLEDSDNYSDCVGEKVYTQREIEKLRS